MKNKIKTISEHKSNIKYLDDLLRLNPRLDSYEFDIYLKYNSYLLFARNKYYTRDIQFSHETLKPNKYLSFRSIVHIDINEAYNIFKSAGIKFNIVWPDFSIKTISVDIEYLSKIRKFNLLLEEI